MTQAALHRLYNPIKSRLPDWLHHALRSTGTAMLGPFFFAYNSGFWRSSFARKAVDRRGRPVPWYTYPANDFLRYRDFTDKHVLEFGGGQSTLWWAERAASVFTLDGDREWFNHLARQVPANVSLHHVSMESAEVNAREVRAAITSAAEGLFDVICIDGLFRTEMIAVAQEHLAPGGAIICDNAEGYGFHETLADSELQRVDFFGHTPGVAFQHATSIYFGDDCFLFSAKHPIPVIALEKD